MESLRLIPQLFYDMLSRILPGLVGLYCLSVARGGNLGDITTHVFGGSPTLGASVPCVLIALSIAGYFLGHALALLADVYERTFHVLFPRSFNTLSRYLSKDGTLCPSDKAFLRRHTDGIPGGAPLKTKIWIWYDWLRTYQQGNAGERCAKVRAEYRMHASLAVLCLVVIAVHMEAVLLCGISFSWRLISTAICSHMMFAWAHARTFKMFERNVIHAFIAAGNAPTSTT